MIQETAHASLGEWESFYVIVGSSAAALTGLQFVVMTLVSEIMSNRTSNREIDAFGTPTVVHFCAALLVSATLSAPWPRLVAPAVMVGACGVGGLIYTAIVVRRARSQTGYTMVAEDWIWHVILPAIAYGAQLLAGIRLERDTLVSLFAVGGSTLLLVYIGIHNAWDTTTFITARRLSSDPAATAGTAPPATAVAAQPVAATGDGR